LTVSKLINMKSNGPIFRYSEAFKNQVLQEIESGALNFTTARNKYGIRGVQTIQSWAKKYGSFGILPKIIRVESPNERDQIKDLKAQIKQLKHALADVTVDRIIAESTLEVICEQRGLDVEEVKKKAGLLLQERAKGKEEK
jgi:transposase-like protein